MGRDRRELTQASWWLQAQPGAVSHAAATGVIMAGTALITLPQGGISSMSAGIEIFAGSTVTVRGRIRRCAHSRSRRRRRVYT